MFESRFIDTRNGPIHVRLRHGDGGRHYFMLHGLGGSSLNWEPMSSHLEGMITALDLPGFGLSAPRPGHQLERHVEAAIEVLTTLDEPVTLVGNSMGGLVAEIVASRVAVDSLVLIAPATPLPFGTLPSDPRMVGRLAIQSLPVIGPAYTRLLAEAGTPSDQVRRIFQVIAADPASISPDFLAASVRLATLRRNVAWAYKSFSGSARSVGLRLLDRRAFVETIDLIEAPTLLLWGDRDRIVTPAALQWLASRRPDWTAVELTSMGHVPMLEAPATTADLVSGWLDRADLTTANTG